MSPTATTTRTQSSSSAYAISNLANGTLVSEAMVTIPSTTYTVNAYLHGEMDSVGSQGNWQINVCFYKFDGMLSSCSLVPFASAASPAANWTQVSGTVTSPADAATMKLELVGAQLSGWLAWDDVTAIQGQVITKSYYAGSQRVAMRKNGVLNYLLGDHLGSASVVTDAGGSLLSKMLYKPWGEERYSSGVMPTDRLYTGQIAEPNLGLYFYNARWYDPALGRFAQADTIIPQPGNPQSWDRYSYVYNNPVKYTDPSGHFTEDAITEYLMGYFEGDEEAALRTLQLWKQNTDWWEMISLAQGGDNLFGCQWYTTGNPSRPTGGYSEGINAGFKGLGQDHLAGLDGFDLVALQTGHVNQWNIEWDGIYRQSNHEAPTFWTRKGVDWYTVVRKPGSAKTSTIILDVLFAVELPLFMHFLGVPIAPDVAIAGLQQLGSSISGISPGELAIDVLNWEQNDIQVHSKHSELHFQLIDGKYYSGEQ